MSLVEIVDASAEDCGAVAGFIAQLWTASGGPEPDAEVVADRARSIMSHYDTLLFTDGLVRIGYAAVQDNGDHIFVRHYVLDRARRGRGLGRELFDRMARERYPGRRFRLDARLDATNARAFWESMGFEATAVTMEHPGRDAQ